MATAMEHFLLILALLIRGLNGQDDKGSTSNNNSIPFNALPDLPNAIHYPIYVPQFNPSAFSGSALDPLSAVASSPWMHSLSPSTQLALEWRASSPFLAEVYDEQQLLQQRDLIYRRREEMRKEREKLKQQQHLLSESMRDRFPNLIQDTNPLIPKPVVDEYDHRHPAASHDNSRKRTASGSESSYIPEDTVFSDRQAAVREIPVSSFESYMQEQRNLRKESEQGRSPEAIHLHYFSRVRQ